MEEGRIYKFVNKEYGVSYSVTEEKLKVLNTSYNKEVYNSRRQYYINNTYCFSDLDTEEYSAEEKIADKERSIESQAMLPQLIEQLFSILTPLEKKVVLRMLIEGYHATELEEELDKKVHEIRRCKKKALEKMKKYLENMGIENFGEAEKLFLK